MGDKTCPDCGTPYVYEDLTLGGITAGYPRCPKCAPLEEESQGDICKECGGLVGECDHGLNRGSAGAMGW